jgi:hypothetical protein
MAKRDNHYEMAFEQYLRSKEIPYVAVDETNRARLGGGSLKSLDFIVSPPAGSSWLVDIKGRHFPAGRQKQYWRNWSTRDDIRGLTAWQQLFGAGFKSLFVFAYQIVGDQSPLPREQLFEYHGALYAFVGVTLDDYARLARPLSRAWDTLSVPTNSFKSVAAGVEDFFCRVEPPDSWEGDLTPLAEAG